MWENNLRQCDLDLQVVRHPTVDGLILYAFRIRLALDVQLAEAKLRALAAGVLFAAAFMCCRRNSRIGSGAARICADGVDARSLEIATRVRRAN